MFEYVKVYNDVLPIEFCKNLIDRFETKNDSLVHRKSSWAADYKEFDELCITRENDFVDVLDFYYEKMELVKNQFVEDCRLEFFPEKYGYEEARMKRYLCNGVHQFGWHVDVGDADSSKRFLVMLTYLNDVECGGETIFRDPYGNEIFSPPKAGTVVCFHPGWMYPHIGTPPISNNKYIISTYLHYV